MSKTQAELEAVSRTIITNAAVLAGTVDDIIGDLVVRPQSDPLRIDGYVMPVPGDASEWYFASNHTPPRHYGLDINLRKSPRGDVELGYPILATCNGVVIFAQKTRDRSWGNLIVTMSVDDKGAIYWRYGHCQDIMVQRGEYVLAGQQIGTIGKGYNDRYFAHLDTGAARGLQGPAEWGTPDVEWIDPLEEWKAAGAVWNWGSR